ncbi:MAG: response regulator [Pseudomonadota bacterium]
MPTNLKPSHYVLYIDDEALAVRYFEEFFSAEFPILTATSIQEAREIIGARGREIAIIVSDHRMPSGSGVALLSEINQTFPEIIRILTTAYASLDNSLLAINQGRIFAYVTKPWNIENMRAILHSAYREFDKHQAFLALAASIAHEMRNPLAQVKYSLDSIRDSLPIQVGNETSAALSTAQSEELFDAVQQGLTAIKRGERVILDIMNEVSHKPIDPSTFVYLSAAETTQKAIDESFETHAESNKVFLKVVKEFTFKAEETSYLFILFNLIKNALYYFKDLPQARLDITVDGHSNTVKVRDTGPGIPAPVLARLFASFVSSGKVGGTGLGLAYCKRSMQAFGGDITCDSVLNEFTEFTLHFPPVSAQALAAYQQEKIANARPFLQGKSILIADANEATRTTLRHALQDFNCAIDEAANGQHAIDMLKNKSYAAALFALNMPILDGYAATEQIRSGIVPGQENIPILAHSGESSFIAEVKSKRVGINAFVRQPCTQLQLIDALCKAIAQAAQKTVAENSQDVLAGKTIIVADDDPLNRRLIKRYLQEHKLTVLEATDGAAILALLQTHTVAAILADMMMHPGMGGVAASKLIRAGNIQANVPIIALTANFTDKAIEEARLAGMNDFISKPIERDTLLAKLVQHLSTQQSTTRRASSGTAAERSLESSAQPAKSKDEPPLLDLHRLEMLQEFICDEWPNYRGKLKALLVQLRDSVNNAKHSDAHKSLHDLLGMAGNLCAQALHQQAKHFYRAVLAGQWPTEQDWLEQLEHIGEKTDLALHTFYLDQANRKTLDVLARQSTHEAQHQPLWRNAKRINEYIAFSRIPLQAQILEDMTKLYADLVELNKNPELETSNFVVDSLFNLSSFCRLAAVHTYLKHHVCFVFQRGEFPPENWIDKLKLMLDWTAQNLAEKHHS